MRISLNDAELDAAAARLNGVQAGVQGVQGRLNPGLSAGAPPAIKGQVDSAVADARGLVSGVAGRCSARSTELRRRAIYARIADGEINPADLQQLLAWNAQAAAVDAARAKPKGGGFLDGLGEAVGDVAGVVGRNASAIGHTALDGVGLVPVLGEVADGANALFYLAEGNKTMAALSAAAMVPLLGYGASATKYGKKINDAFAASKAVSGTKGAAVKASQRAGDMVENLARGRKMPDPSVHPPKVGWHHTKDPDIAELIGESGLRPGGFVSDRPYGPRGATIRLALPGANKHPTGVVKIDLAKMRDDGIDVPQFTRVEPKYNQIGGGWEIVFPRRVPEDYLQALPRKKP